MPRPDADALLRFSKGQRRVHRSLALLMGVCMLTAAALYLPSVSQVVGHRIVVARVHEICGVALIVPLVAGWFWSASFRADVRRLERFIPQDWQWLRDPERRSGLIDIGKFNPGQKLNAAFTLGAILVMLGTGLVMRYPQWWPLAWRTGATLVHDWLAFAIVMMFLGHVWFAWRDAEARRGMRSGVVSRAWARREHPRWAREAEDHPEGHTPARSSDVG
jgi:formate dehydrogenase subunit gamma